MYGYVRRKPNKQPRKLTHEQKRQVAKKVIDGKMVKQVAAEWNISLWQCYTIVSEYTVLTRTEKYPDDAGTSGPVLDA